jgi:DNA repair protein RadC
MKKEYNTLVKYSLKKEPTNFEKVEIKSSHDSRNYIAQFYGDDKEIYESFFLLILNRANKTTGYVKISQGGSAGTVVDITILAKYCINSLAQAVIIAHNHPSGNIKPSDADIRMTKQIKKALDLFSIPLLDHIILSGENDTFFSFADADLL